MLIDPCWSIPVRTCVVVPEATHVVEAPQGRGSGILRRAVPAVTYGAFRKAQEMRRGAGGSGYSAFGRMVPNERTIVAAELGLF
jgi:hypothetical protein